MDKDDLEVLWRNY